MISNYVSVLKRDSFVSVIMVIFLGGLTMAVTKKSMKDEGLCCCFYDPKKISYD